MTTGCELLACGVPALMRCTPYQLTLMMEGARRRRRFEAQMVANLMNVSGKVLRKPIDGDDLLGVSKPVRKSARSSEDMSEEEKASAVQRMLEKAARPKRLRGGKN